MAPPFGFPNPYRVPGVPDTYAMPGSYPLSNPSSSADHSVVVPSANHGPYTSAPGAPAAYPNSYPGPPVSSIPLPSPYVDPLGAPPRRAPSGRMANRKGFNGITMHEPSSAPSPAQGPPGSVHGQYLGPYMPSIQAQPTPPMMGRDGMSGGIHETTGQFPSMSSLQGTLSEPQSSQQDGPPKRPDFLVIGLFALRLTKRLIEKLDPYEGRDSDLHWLSHFLKPYHSSYALVRLTDHGAIDNYVTEYPRTVRRIIKQPRFPKVFMEMNPDKKVTNRELTDEELSAIIDFADAASEWGSVVPIPGKYAQRMEELANRRSLAE